MSEKTKIIFFIVLSLAAMALTVVFLDSSRVDVLNPKGWIAIKERSLIIITTVLMLIIVIPVFIMTFVITWKYRASNLKAKYTPDWDYDRVAESIWWGFPCVIIIALSVITWKSCYELDPFKPLDAAAKPIKIQVVALQWKWLFIYPEHNIATINFIQFPEKTPINFEITSDAPMNSFWIPQLAGQIYAMPGMTSKLHLIADEEGSFRGVSANLSGRGFSGMTFIAKSSTQADFDAWVQSVKASPEQLTLDEYQKLIDPSENHPIVSYLLAEEGLYDQIVMKYMMP